MVVGILYYSAKCNYCYDLMKLLKIHELDTLLRYERVDNMSLDELQKLKITAVPEIRLSESSDNKLIHSGVSNDNKFIHYHSEVSNDNKFIHSGTDAFTWVSNYIKKTRLSKI